MISKIVFPVDLAHAERLGKALKVAIDLAKGHDAEIIFIGVTSTTPTTVANNPDEYAKALDEFAATEGMIHHVKVADKMVLSHDPSIDLGQQLIDAADEAGADLIVMASHMPGLADHLFEGNAAYVAQHAPLSVYIVR